MTVKTDRDALVLLSRYDTKFKRKFIFMSDIHFDSKYCERALFRDHLEYAKQNDARVFIIGDFFDCMGGKYDKRTNKEDLRPEYQTANYFDSIVDSAYKFLQPYADIIEMISDGNHELSVLRRHETDLTERLTSLLGCHHGPYSGFLRLKFERESQGARSSELIYWSHGTGGNSPVTKGVIQSNRRQVSIDADVYVSGHNHNEWVMPLTIATLTDMNTLKVKKKLHINTGCYKQEWGKTDFSQEKGFTPENIGCVELEYYYKQREIRRRYRILE